MELDLVLLHLLFVFTFSSAAKFPTLNKDDVVVSEKTNDSAKLTWKRELISRYDNYNPLRLFVYIWIMDDVHPIYMNPTDGNPYCSLQLSYCHLRFLSPGTVYRVEVTIDESEAPSRGRLGEAKVTFETEATPVKVCSKDNKVESWLLPISGGFNLLLTILICILLYRWCCGSHHDQSTAQVPEIVVTNNNGASARRNFQDSSIHSSNDGFPSYAPMNLSGNQMLVVQSQANVEMRTTTTFSQSQSSIRYENERMRSGDSNALYDNASIRGSRQNVAQQQQQQQQQQQASCSNKGHPIYANVLFPPCPTSSS